MINLLFYIGMTLQSEVCLWTLLGLLRTIFNATLFKVNANLKQVWQMQMPVELSLPLQRILRTIISGLMLVQCFTVYVYLASYIVLLYPAFLEERPTLVLPWLLLGAIRNLLCELTSLALGLGTCVLLGPARPPCIKFVILKLFSIMPAFYMWLLVFSYYHRLKVASTFKTFPAVSPSKDLDYGLELAVRRRRTKTLLGEDQVRKRLMDSLYCEPRESQQIVKIDETYKISSNSSNDSINKSCTETYPLTLVSTKTISDIGRYEDWFGSEVVVPRDTDRILEQIVLMLLRIGVFLGKENTDAVKFLSSSSQAYLPRTRKVECISTEMGETPPVVASSKGRIASYLRDYPQIFMKKPSGLLCSLSSPLRLHDNIKILENIQSFESLETSSMCESNGSLPTNEIESPSVTLTVRSLTKTGNSKEIIPSPLFEAKQTDSVSSMSESEIHLKTANEFKSPSKTFIDTKEGVGKDLTGKYTENNIGQTSKETRSINSKLSESIESVLNRMKIRAACMVMPSPTSNNRNSASPANESERAESSKNSNKNKSNKFKAHN